ncbi:M20 metallopeptidase family protein [Leucobacter aridicollis]|uniref:M20 metallopeptidase family protein n=1 Tax=Leucobacter aridicollis TaxID=283878 RepID=UPI0021696EDB|nr:M20 family metallopeptidase [Leucobacter aridicollis]MCS3427386.1 hippurate hydrolase [Leucobacter aridicollis]
MTLPTPLQQLRRELHRHPELGLHLPDTRARIERELAPLDIELSFSEQLSSIVGVLRGNPTGRAVLLRADMDALPVAEPAGLEYASERPGAMHACGHDLHMAGLVGAARLLAARRDDLEGDVVFMFQPGEERLGGARIMLAEGVLDAAGPRVGAAFAVHVSPGARGTFLTRSGPTLAGSNELRVRIVGQGGHGSQPHTARNPIPVAAEAVGVMQSFTARRLDPFDSAIITPTVIRAGDAINVIPESVELGATVRNFSAATLARVGSDLVEELKGLARAHGMTAEVTLNIDYPVTVNDGVATEWAVAELAELLGAERVAELAQPIMGSEDFAYVAERVPSTIFMLGASPDGVEPSTAAPNHSPRVVFDDAVLDDQAAALAALAEGWLARGWRALGDRAEVDA